MAIASVLVLVLGLMWLLRPAEVAHVDEPDADRRTVTQPKPARLDEHPSTEQIELSAVEGGARLRGRIEDATGGVIEGAFVSVEDADGTSRATTL